MIENNVYNQKRKVQVDLFDILNLNKNLDTSIQKINNSTKTFGEILNRKTVQKTILDSFSVEQKIFNNIDLYDKFWCIFFPEIIDSHFALDSDRITGITDTHSKLDDNPCNFKLKYEFNILFEIINNLNSKLKMLKNDDIIINILESNIILFEIVELNEKIKFVPKAENNTIPLYDSKNEEILELSNPILLDNINNSGNKLYRKTFSVRKIQSILKLLKKYQIESEMNRFKEIILFFNDSNLRIIPKLDSTKKLYSIILARKLEKEEYT